MISQELEAVLFKATGLTYAQRKAKQEAQRSADAIRFGMPEPTDADLDDMRAAAYNAEEYE